MNSPTKEVDVRVLEMAGYRVELNLANQVLGIDIPEDRDLGGTWDAEAGATVKLEPLVRPEATPEAARLKLRRGYRDQLVELFQGILTLTRETHIKQLEIPPCGAAEPSAPDKRVLHIAPQLSTEPLYSYFLRRALGYRFLWQCLDGAFGPAAVAGIPTVTQAGPGTQTLAQTIGEISGLFHGAAVVVARQLGGLDPASDAQQMVEHLN
jgi:hypothetical protein